MRLIDTDEMNEKLFYRELGGKDVLITAKSVFDMIKALPTAYDVEKVVAELEEEKYTREEKFQYDTRTQEKMSSYNMGLNKAISVVKRGGEK